MDTRSTHLLVEYHGCDRATLDDRASIEALLRRAADAAGATVVAVVLQPFVPQGVSGVVVIEESHLSIHTWPECGYAAVDFFTCGDCRPERAREVIGQGLAAERSEVLVVERGLRERPGMRVLSHHSDEEPSAATEG